MTDVVIQHLTTEQKVRIKCNDYVKKLAVYKDCLAIQLPKRITVYQLTAGADTTDMRYKPLAVIEQELECNLLVVTAHHLTLCQVRGLALACKPISANPYHWLTFARVPAVTAQLVESILVSAELSWLHESNCALAPAMFDVCKYFVSLQHGPF